MTTIVIPNLLDIVKIDGKWMQVMGGGGLIKLLQTGEVRLIDWRHYNFAKSFTGSSVFNVTVLDEEKFTKEEMENMHHIAETQDEYPEIKLQTKVFGEFVRIKNKVA